MDDVTKTDKMLSRKEGNVGYVIFNNPERHNAVSLEMWARTAEILDEFAQRRRGARGGDHRRRRQVVRVGRRHLEVRERARLAGRHQDLQRDGRQGERERSTSSRKPTIAMIRGYCIGGGLGLAVCCDLRICSDNSKFGIPAAKLGLGYSYPGVKRLSDLVGPSFAKEIFFTARQFDAEEARVMGLVNRVVPPAELEAYVKNYADTIAGNAPLTVKAAKFIANETVRDESKRNLARCTELVEQCFNSNDYTEGRRAFMEKRKPTFTGT